jgi:uncharacterized membrane protein
LALITALAASRFSAVEFALRVGSVAAFVAVSALLVVVFIAAMTTYQIGIFAIFGGFMMGVILFDEPGLVAAWRE